jgi:hypothetical protein
MTLTEQWKKGELEAGWYYVNNGQIDYKYSKHSFVDFFVTPHEDIKEVLAPVPSYVEWQELKEFADYSLHNRDELTRQINFWMDKHTQFEKENQQLKELLRKYRSDLMSCFTVGYEDSEFIKKIDEVLK